MRRFLEKEIARAASRRTHPAYFEEKFGEKSGNALPLGDGMAGLRGVIDRIDLTDDDPTRAIVVDYKSSVQMNKRQIEEGQVIQAPIYALALERIFGLHALGAEFMGLRKGEPIGIYQQEVPALYGTARGLHVLDAGAWQTFLDDSEARLCAAIAGMREGAIALAPSTDRCAEKCEYFPLCRGDRFALARRRESATSVKPVL